MISTSLKGGNKHNIYDISIYIYMISKYMYIYMISIYLSVYLSVYLSIYLLNCTDAQMMTTLFSVALTLVVSTGLSCLHLE
jgi:uncharacterized membrane protein